MFRMACSDGLAHVHLETFETLAMRAFFSVDPIAIGDLIRVRPTFVSGRSWPNLAGVTTVTGASHNSFRPLVFIGHLFQTLHSPS